MAMSPDEKTEFKELIKLTIENSVLKATQDITNKQGLHSEKIKNLEKQHNDIKTKVEANETRSQTNETNLKNLDVTAKKSGGTWGGIISGISIALKLIWDYFHHTGGN